MLLRLLGTIFVLSLVAAAALADDSGIKIERAWARATPSPAVPGAVYFAITNSGAGEDRLLQIATPVAGKAEMHMSVMEGSVMEMRPVDAVDLKPGAQVEFKPGGLHVMLVQLKQPLKQGERFPLTLTFEKSGAQEIQVLVLPMGASGYP